MPICATVLAVVVTAAFFSTPQASAAGQFTFLQPGFTQELYGTAPSFFGGVAFAHNADLWVDSCAFVAGPLQRFDNSTTTLVNGSNVHPLLSGSPFASNAGCGLTNSPDGFLYSNTDTGVVQINRATGAATGIVFGESGNGLGIASDPHTGRLVYVRSDGTILTAAPGGPSSTFSSATSGSFIDGIAFDPTGNFLFASNRTLDVVTILGRSGALVQNSETISGVPDGISFHALSPKFALTSNNNGSLTRLDFPGDDYTKPPVSSVFASGGFRGDLTQVGGDGCVYVTQDGTRYDNKTVTASNSIVRVCPGFAPTSGVESDINLTPKVATGPAGGEHTLTATVLEEGTGPVAGAPVTFVLSGQNTGVKGTCTTPKGAPAPSCATDATGGVKFSYADLNGAGEDQIDASVTVKGSTEHATATKIWEAPVAQACTQAFGSGRFLTGSERQSIAENVNTSLTGPEVFHVGINHGERQFRLRHLNSASCVVTAGGREFKGQGTAYVHGRKGYAIAFSISVAGNQGNISVVLEKGGTVLYTIHAEPLTVSHEHIA
jgi:hypothetical protein